MRMDATVTGVHLRVPGFSDLCDFYQLALGMKVSRNTDETLSFEFSEHSCQLIFSKDDVSAFIDRPNNFYWKIGITVKNLDAAVRFLSEAGVEVSKPGQFQDIGYLCHLQDPNGLTIELLQCGFQGNEQALGEGHPIGAQATLAHLTLRVTDIAAAEKYFVHELGMRLMSVQPVNDYGFCLYFYTWSNEVLPNPDIESVDNREWLWARPYTLIELQHLQAPGAVIHLEDTNESGFKGFSYSGIESGNVFVSKEALGGIAAPVFRAQ